VVGIGAVLSIVLGLFLSVDGFILCLSFSCIYYQYIQLFLLSSKDVVAGAVMPVGRGYECAHTKEKRVAMWSYPLG